MYVTGRLWRRSIVAPHANAQHKINDPKRNSPARERAFNARIWTASGCTVCREADFGGPHPMRRLG